MWICHSQSRAHVFSSSDIHGQQNNEHAKTDRRQRPLPYNRLHTSAPPQTQHEIAGEPLTDEDDCCSATDCCDDPDDPYAKAYRLAPEGTIWAENGCETGCGRRYGGLERERGLTIALRAITPMIARYHYGPEVLRKLMPPVAALPSATATWTCSFSGSLTLTTGRPLCGSSYPPGPSRPRSSRRLYSGVAE